MSTKLAIGISVLVAGLTLGLWIGLRLGELKGLSGSSDRQGRALGIEGKLATSGPGEGSPTPTWEPTNSSPTPSSYPTEEPTPYETPYPTDFDSSGPGSGESSEENYTVDRLAQVDEATLACIKERLNDSELEMMRFLVPTTSEEEEELRKIEEKASICFESYSEIVKIEEASGKISELSDGVEECLRHEVGDLAFEQINSGLREPTEEEMRRGEKCFEGKYESEIRYQTDERELAQDVENCLKLAIGEEKFEQIKKGIAQPTLSEREKVERCFGASPQPFQGRPKFEIPSEIDACLRESVGLERYEAIKSGMSEPTEEERVKGEQCFDKLNGTQVNFLPAPPEQVPYLTSVPGLVEVSAIGEKIVEVSPGVFDRILIISGSGPPNSLVDIYVFSEPIVVTTKTDANGDWVYEMNQPLEGETHVAYATARAGTGQIVRSSVFNFQVVAATDLGLPLLEESRATGVPSRFLTYAIGIIGLGVVVAIVGVGYVYLKRMNLGGDGKGKGEDTTGPVN